MKNIKELATNLLEIVNRSLLIIDEQFPSYKEDIREILSLTISINNDIDYLELNKMTIRMCSPK